MVTLADDEPLGTNLMDEKPQQVTQILEAVGAGDAQAAEKLLPLVYDELRRLAAAKMAREAPGQTLQPTALVHEAWLRLAGQEQQCWENRARFFAAASEAMRRILVDRARRRQAARHGGGLERVNFKSLELPIESDTRPPLAHSRSAGRAGRGGTDASGGGQTALLRGDEPRGDRRSAQRLAEDSQAGPGRTPKPGCNERWRCDEAKKPRRPCPFLSLKFAILNRSMKFVNG